MEIWKDVPKYEGLYQVSNLGNVKSLRYSKYRTLKLTLDVHGYLRVSLFDNYKLKVFKIHQLVAISFLGHTPCGYKLVVNHINFIRTDNRVENLEIITFRENSNKKHLKSSSQYVGVSWDKQYKKWRAKIQINGKSKHLGMFTNEIDAHLAYQNKLNEIY